MSIQADVAVSEEACGFGQDDDCDVRQVGTRSDKGFQAKNHDYTQDSGSKIPTSRNEAPHFSWGVPNGTTVEGTCPSGPYSSGRYWPGFDYIFDSDLPSFGTAEYIPSHLSPSVDEVSGFSGNILDHLGDVDYSRVSSPPDDTYRFDYPLGFYNMDDNLDPTALRGILARTQLSKEQVDLLEHQFQQHPKPNSSVKRQLAQQTNLALPRISNWFQDRRAKALQAKKQAEFELWLAEKQSLANKTQTSLPTTATASSTQEASYASLQRALNAATATKGLAPLTDGDSHGTKWMPLPGANLQACIPESTNEKDTPLYQRTQKLSLTEQIMAEDPNQRNDNESEGCLIFSDWPSTRSDMGSWPSNLDAGHAMDSDVRIKNPPVSDEESPPRSEKSQESTSDSNNTEFVEDDEELVIVLAKHRLLVKYMEVFYSLLGSPCGNFVSCGQGNSNVTSSSGPGDSNNQKQNDNSKGKKRKASEGSTPDEDEEDAQPKRGGGWPSTEGNTTNRPFACQFYKFDPSRYSCTAVTGSKYRTCAGPGFHSIARLKQHLKRVHSVPQFQCLRCWQIVLDHEALAAHLQEDIRCPKLDQPPVEGIPQHRWDMIKSRWGDSWSSIFEIIFPGAPIPSPYYEVEAKIELPRSTSPSSQDVTDYEAYQRSELPRLVEAMLEAMIRAKTDPLDGKFKPLLLEIVRGAHSSLNQRWEMIKGQTSSLGASLPTVQATVDQNLPSDDQKASSPNVAQLPVTTAKSSLVPTSYEIPIPLGGSTEAVSWELLPEIQGLAPSDPRFGYSDSAYESQMTERWCQCDSFIDLSFGEQQDSFEYSSSSNSDSQTMPSQRQPVLGERSGSLNSAPALSPREKSVVRCTYCGDWRFKD